MKIRVVDLFGVDYKKMSDRINEEIAKIEVEGGSVKDFKVMGSALNKCAVFLMYE